MARALVIVAAVFAPLALLGGCFSLDGFTGGSSTPDASSVDGAVAATDAGIDALAPPVEDAATDSDSSNAPDAAAPCPTGRGPTMVRISAPGASFCIDSTEVTNAQYRVFLGASPAISQIPACSFSTTLIPSSTTVFNDATKASYPVANVNWCQASAFCAWANKRLCGKLGGGTVPAGDLASSAVSETFLVCTHDGTQNYAYGTAYSNGVCNATGSGMLEPVANRPACQGGYPGVYDLIGNLGEWTDDCAASTGTNDSCSTNSTSWEYVSGDPSISQRCDHFDGQNRGDSYDDLGFRCCSN